MGSIRSYALTETPQVAPRWRVGLALAFTERLNVAPLAAVPQTMVAETEDVRHNHPLTPPM